MFILKSDGSWKQLIPPPSSNQFKVLKMCEKVKILTIFINNVFSLFYLLFNFQKYEIYIITQNVHADDTNQNSYI